MPNRNSLGKSKDELLTPCLLLDIQAAQRNIDRMASYFTPLECQLRPHAKTHKLPWIARKQINAGAIGITCAKLQDAQAFARAGIEHILIANQVVGTRKIELWAELAGSAEILACVDSLHNAEEVSAIAAAKSVVLDVLIEVDVGLGRCGILPGQPALEFLRSIAKLRGIHFRGLMGYEGGLFIQDEQKKLDLCRQRNQALVETRRLIEDQGFEVEIVSAGGANTYQITGNCPGITEIQPGSYVNMDDCNRKFGLDFEQAVTILSTVISRPTKDRAIIDAGLKAISTDHGLPRIASHQGLTVQALNEEHGKLLLDDSSPDLKIGDRIQIVPTHGCTTIPLYPKYIAIEGDRVVDEYPLISGSAVY